MINYLPRLVGIGSVQLIRSFHQSSRNRYLNWGSYDGPGKTTVTIMNTTQKEGLLVTDVTTGGFKFNNGYWVLGPTIVFPRTILSWNISSTDDITEESLVLFKVIEPTVDILVIGLDRQYKPNTPFLKNIKDFAKKMNIRTDISLTENACTTFNFLNTERRYVAGIFLPPKYEAAQIADKLEQIAMRRRLRAIDKHDPY